MVVTCQHVWNEISNYIDGEVQPALRVAMEEHIHGCQQCTAVLDGMRNVVELYGDERMLEVPFGYSQRLHRRLDENMPATRRNFLGWMVAAAATLLIAGSIEVARSASRGPGVRSELAQVGNGVPPDMTVVVSENGRLFHVPGCDYIHEKDQMRTVTAAEAQSAGYVPCVRCMKKYLTTSARSNKSYGETRESAATADRQSS